MTSTPPYNQAAVPPAAVRSRVVAGAIDLIGGGALVAGLGVLLSLVIPGSPIAWLAAAAVVAVPRELALALTGWSPGGRLMGVRLVDAATGGPPKTRLFIHADLLCVTVGLGAIVFMHSAAADPRGQGWHDRMAGTLAVSTRSARAARSGSAAAPRRQAPAQQALAQQDVKQQAPKRQTPRRQSIRHQTQAAVPAQHAAARVSARERARVFPDNEFFLSPDGSSTDIGSTVDTTSAVALPPASDRAIIDSVPWAAVPTQLDMPTGDYSPLISPAPASPAPTGPGAAGSFSASSASDGPRPTASAPTDSEPASPPDAEEPFSPPPPMVHPLSMPAAQTEALPVTFSPAEPARAASAPTPAPTGSSPIASVPTASPGGPAASPSSLSPSSPPRPAPASPSPEPVGAPSGPPVPVGPFPVPPPTAGPRPGAPFSAGPPSASPSTSTSSAPYGVSSSSPHEAVVPSPVTASAPRSPSPEEAIIVPPSFESLPPSSSTPPARSRAAARSAASAEPMISADSVPAAQPVVSASSPSTTARGRHRQTEDPRAKRLVPLAGGAPVELSSTTVVGRDPDNISDYPGAACASLNDANRSISKTHAALAPAPGGLWLTDLHSTNGTRIEEDGHVTVAKPGESVPVPTGATIVLGSAAYRVED